MIELVTCLLHPNNKKRLTAEEALGKLRNDDDVTRRAVRWSTSAQHMLYKLSR
jgi:translation initiation factor 2-alpha kinase 4